MVAVSHLKHYVFDMDAKGQIWLNATPPQVWAAMTDPEVLKQCVPGCRDVTIAAEHDYRFDLAGRWGVISAKFQVQVLIHDIEPAAAVTPYRYALSAQGEGPLGLAKGRSRIALEPHQDGTMLHYNADGAPDERLGKLGRPVLNRAANALSKKFFDRFANVLNTHGR